MKRPDQYLVDAHNLGYRDPDIGPLLRKNPESGRRLIEERLAGRKRIWLFYDGGPDGHATQTVRHGLHISYSGNREADDCIVDWLRRHATQRVCVVTADRELKARCRRWTTHFLAPEDFVSRFMEIDIDTEEADRGPPPADEVDFWLRQFGEGDAN